MLNCVCSRIKSIFLAIIGIFRRALCCFSRKRTHGDDGDEVLTGINVQHSNYSPKKNHLDRDWNSWDDSPRTVEEHIEKYREKLAQKIIPVAATSSVQDQNAPEPEPDYFGDMEPTTIKQAKYLIANDVDEEGGHGFSRLQASVQADIPISNELEDWDEDSQAAGWDEIDNENTKQLIRDTKRELRSQKHYQKQKERNPTPASYLQAERLNTTGDR